MKPGRYTFSIGTAGATALVLHTVYLPLALRGTEPSEITITGGTHNQHAPCYHFLETTWAAFLRRMGIEVEVAMARAGFYPRGGGEIRATIHPCSRVRGVNLLSSPELTTAGGFSRSRRCPNPSADDRRGGSRTASSRKGRVAHSAGGVGGREPGSVAAVIFRQLRSRAVLRSW